jgi:hypothetical protein
MRLQTCSVAWKLIWDFCIAMHGLLQADLGVAQLHLGLQPRRLVLCLADRFQGTLEVLREATAHAASSARAFAGDTTQATERLAGQSADSKIHGRFLAQKGLALMLGTDAPRGWEISGQSTALSTLWPGGGLE